VKVLLTGATGQVGRAIQDSVPADTNLRTLSHAQLNIRDHAAVYAVVSAWQPALIINAAAYTAVDKAETEPEAALAINGQGPRHLAIAARAVPNCRLLQLSTDYVFDGSGSDPYKSGDATHPLGVYGRSKLEGEQAVRSILSDRSVILRTAWVYSAHGRNFLLTMLRLMREHLVVRVVSDQHGTPTSADSIARAIWAIAKRPELSGVLHWTDGGTATWYDFALAIAEEAHAAGLMPEKAKVTPIKTADYPTAARRPLNSVLDTRESIAQLGFSPAPWRVELRETLQRLIVA
jgi:dTDP-4-dehydrorhamnose reductase